MGNIFSIKSSKKLKEDKMVGAYIDSDINSYLVLYTIAKRINKSNLLRNLITNWYDQEKGKEPPDKLIRELISTAQEEWYRIKPSAIKSFSKFKTDLWAELRSRGLCAEYVSKIVDNLRQ